MVWPFKKSKVLDFTKENFKVPATMKTRLESEYKELNSNPGTETQESALGFLGAMASSSEENTGDELTFKSQKLEISDDYQKHLFLKHLKVKIEDAEYKINNMSKRLNSILDRIDLMEKKLDKFERRGV